MTMRWPALACLLSFMLLAATVQAAGSPFAGVDWAKLLHVAPSGKTEDGGRYYLDAVLAGQLENGLWLAAIPWDGGGTAAVMFYRAFVATPNGPQPIGQANGNKMTAIFEHGQFVTFSGEYRTGDGNCCPSRWREVHYTTDGKHFVVVGTKLLTPDQYDKRLGR